MRMKFSAGFLKWEQGRPAVTTLIAQHTMFQIRISNRGPRFASQTNTQMKSGTEQSRGLTIRISREQSQPLWECDQRGINDWNGQVKTPWSTYICTENYEASGKLQVERVNFLRTDVAGQ
jgi:hypothetical protein